jgi:hypothetical protein
VVSLAALPLRPKRYSAVPRETNLETGVLTALISGAAAVLLAALTYMLTKRREQESAWRDLKLKHYQEYVTALSAVVGGRATIENRARYADAGNTLSLVAPPLVLRALYEFQDEISLRGEARDRARHDVKLTALMRAMRADAQAGLMFDDEGELNFRLFASGPSSEPGDGLDNGLWPKG